MYLSPRANRSGIPHLQDPLVDTAEARSVNVDLEKLPLPAQKFAWLPVPTASWSLTDATRAATATRAVLDIAINARGSSDNGHLPKSLHWRNAIRIDQSTATPSIYSSLLLDVEREVRQQQSQCASALVSSSVSCVDLNLSN